MNFDEHGDGLDLYCILRGGFNFYPSVGVRFQHESLCDEETTICALLRWFEVFFLLHEVSVSVAAESSDNDIDCTTIR